MNISWTIGVGIIAVVTLAIAQGLVKKTSTRKMFTWLAIGGVIVAILGFANVIPNLNENIGFLAVAGGGTGVETPEPGTNLQADVLGCDLGTKTTVTLAGVNQYSNAPVGDYNRYKINGAPAVDLADAGTFTASPGDKITVLWANESKVLYFSQVGEYVVPCTGAKTFYANLVNNGTLTSSVKNSDDTLMDGTATNQSMGAGDVKTVSIKLTGTYQKGFPYGFVAVIDMNKTSYDDVTLTDSAGIELPTANVPQSFSYSYYVTESSKKAYEIPAIMSNAEIVIKAVLDADDTNAPTGAGQGADVVVWVYPKNYFINEDKLGAFEGPAVENEDSGLTRTGGFNVTIQVH